MSDKSGYLSGLLKLIANLDEFSIQLRRLEKLEGVFERSRKLEDKYEVLSERFARIEAGVSIKLNDAKEVKQDIKELKEDIKELRSILEAQKYDLIDQKLIKIERYISLISDESTSNANKSHPQLPAKSQ